MRQIVTALMLCVCVIGSAPAAFAVERRLDQLPGDVAMFAFLWAEPLKQAVKESRQHDPISGVWFGLVDGSVKSLERTTSFFRYKDDGTPNEPPQGGKLLKYSF